VIERSRAVWRRAAGVACATVVLLVLATPATATRTGAAGVASGIDRDRPAVIAGLPLPYNSGTAKAPRLGS